MLISYGTVFFSHNEIASVGLSVTETISQTPQIGDFGLAMVMQQRKTQTIQGTVFYMPRCHICGELDMAIVTFNVKHRHLRIHGTRALW